MKSIVRRLSVSTLCVALSGCASLTHYNHAAQIPSGPQVTFVDAKQRALFSAPVWEPQLRTYATKFCAEPSPDALSALAASGSASLSVKDQAALQAAFAMSETAGSIGLRTQSIQLMRDSMFRLCEASLSREKSPQFWSAFRYFQNSMVTILAVEQLTGVAKAPGLQLTTNSGITPNKDIAGLTDTLAKAKATLATDQADASGKKKAMDAAQAAADAYLKASSVDAEDKLPADKVDGYKPLKQAMADNKKASDDATIKVAGDQKLVDAYQASIAALAPTLTATGSAALSDSATASQGQSAVASAVQAIVMEQLRGGFLRQTCATLYDQELEAGHAIAADTKLHAACDQWAMNTATGRADLPMLRSDNNLVANTETMQPVRNLDHRVTLPKMVWPPVPVEPTKKTHK